MSYTEEQVRQAAVSCFVNARDLYEGACLLEKPARYPRALVLAVIGAEEFVKSVVYTIQGWELSARDTFRPSPLGAPGASPVTSQGKSARAVTERDQRRPRTKHCKRTGAVCRPER